MKVFRDYDENCPLSIEAYAQGLKGHTFHDVINWAFESYETGREDASNAIELFGNTYRKGGLGNLLEQLYFGYDIIRAIRNSRHKPKNNSIHIKFQTACNSRHQSAADCY